MIDLNMLSLNITEYMALVVKREPQRVSIDAAHGSDMQTIYEKLLAGAVALRANQRGGSVEKVTPSIKSMIEWLRTTDFYEAPASTRYHESFKGGLLEHSLKVYDKMCKLCTLDEFNEVDKGSAALVTLTHDWCKIHKYEQYIKHVKDDKTGQWHDELAYKYSDKYIGLGHGPQSLMMLSQFCKLTFDEMAAIRWHMTTFDVTSYDLDDMTNCSSKIPLVLLTQFADKLAICEF